MAWINDDYGDGTPSNAMFGGGLTDEQREIADRTRKMVRKEIGSYAEFSGLVGKFVSDPIKAKRLSAIAKRAIIIQWVTAATAEAAEKSFFKINQAAQPIDPIERRILQSRMAPNAIASRCIARGGRGHKYWSAFETSVQEQIEELGSEIYNILYKPPLSEPVTTPDVPIAGKGYNALPFVFNLVSLVNGLKIPNSPNNKTIESALPADGNGQQTVEFLKNVKSRLQLISTNNSGSLGFHPLIYYYAKSGVFLANAFLASLVFAKKLDEQRRKDNFIKIRKRFEDYLHANKLFVTLTISRLGSGARSLDRIENLYWLIFEAMHQEKTDQELYISLTGMSDFSHLKQVDMPSPNADAPPGKRGASKETKSASFIREAMERPIRCHICGGVIHQNSITFDHVIRREDGGDNRSENLRPSHPYCNSGVKC